MFYFYKYIDNVQSIILNIIKGESKFCLAQHLHSESIDEIDREFFTVP